MPRKRKAERHIFPCRTNPRLRAVWWPKFVDHETFTQSGGFVWAQAFDVGWHNVPLGSASQFADTAMEAMARALALFEDPLIKAYAEGLTKEKTHEGA